MDRREFLKLLVWMHLVIAAGCKGNKSFGGGGVNKRLYLIGVDGMDPDIVTAMVGEGSLPNIRLLSEKGTFSRLPTITPPQSPSVWTTLSSGVYPSVHGVTDFILRKA